MGRHDEWRKIAKKMRRKRIRQEKAKALAIEAHTVQEEREASQEYQEWLSDQNKLDELTRMEAERTHNEDEEKWLRTELLAQQQWRQLQDKIAKARFERAGQDLRIKKEWEEQQKKIKEAEEARKKEEEERLKCHEELMKRIEQFTSGEGEIPRELLEGRETNPGKEPCLFFNKTGACRFGDNCSRNHQKPGVSKVILATNFYSHFGIEHSTPNEYDTDILLEYDDNETYNHFKEFFNDVLPEFQKLGKVVQFKVCCNLERHLRGNVYVEFASLKAAVAAYRVFHGRWYGGKQVTLQFCNIASWKRAVCGLFFVKRCPKGRTCNFLHVFKNPGNLFEDYDSAIASAAKHRESHRSHRRSLSRSRSKENRCEWRWSESPVREPRDVQKKTKRRSSRSSSRESRKSRNDYKKNKSESRRTKRLKSVSRSRDRDQPRQRTPGTSERRSRSHRSKTKRSVEKK